MEFPRADRPYMPGYGIAGPDEGSGLLEWSWAAERLTLSRNYWVASAWPDGRPHVMPVWGMWDDSTLWFSSSVASRKTKNLLADPRCVVTTEEASDPVVIEGRARLVTEQSVLQRVIDLVVGFEGIVRAATAIALENPVPRRISPLVEQAARDSGRQA